LEGISFLNRAHAINAPLFAESYVGRYNAMDLPDLRFVEWFQTRSPSCGGENLGVARVTAVDRGSCLIRNGSSEVPAELAGKLFHRFERSEDRPCVGDWVAAQYHNDGTMAIIQGVYPRKSLLRRKTAGERVEVQMIAANLDAAFIVQSCHYDFNLRRLERYLVMAGDGGVEPFVILTKTDLVAPDELAEKLLIVRAAAGVRVFALSNVTGVGFDEFQAALAPGKTYCLLGSSGVGKSTLINRLMGEDVLDTGPVSGTGEGTHVTSRRQLIVLARGAMLIDTPGMRELGLLGSGEGVNAGFEDLAGLSAGCRYANCSHEHEPGCAVRAAVERGELSEGRYANYLKLWKESVFHELSSLERRKKDKAFGRFLKTAKKRLKR
jgi:ribosome biogenesis GTPase / thiamine phosphate phosphatase